MHSKINRKSIETNIRGRSSKTGGEKITEFRCTDQMIYFVYRYGLAKLESIKKCLILLTNSKGGTRNSIKSYINICFKKLFILIVDPIQV